MLPRIDAEERLSAISDGTIAGGTADRFAAHRAIKLLLRDVNGGEEQRAAKATPAVLGRMGIAVRSAPSAPSEKDGSDV